jgi:glutamate 5-kinase
VSGVDKTREAAVRARRIVVKVGSSTLTEDGQLSERAFAEIARQVSELCERGCKMVLVSSGAIAVGSRELGWDEVGPSIPQRQAAAAVGQIGLINLYRERFANHGRRVAQVLVTRAGLENRERFLNARHTLNKLFERERHGGDRRDPLWRQRQSLGHRVEPRGG